MPQRSARKRRLALGASLAIAALLEGCTLAEMEKLAREKEPPVVSNTPSAAVTRSAQPGTFLAYDRSITGGSRAMGANVAVFERLLIGPGNEVVFNRPVAVGGTGNFLYIVDAGPRVVYRYDLIMKTLQVYNEVGPQLGGDPGNIFVAPDESFYLVDPLGKKVLHFSGGGQLLDTLQDLANLSRPMDVLVNPLTNEVLVADGSYSHLVVFNTFGKAVGLVGRRGTGPGRFRAITAMTGTRDGIYVTDRLEMPVQLLGWEGTYRYGFGESKLTFATAVAVDADNRVYVAENSDNTIRVYRDGTLVDTVGGGGSAPGRFRQITDLWAHDGNLYVADSMNRRVQVFRILPEARGSEGGGS